LEVYNQFPSKSDFSHPQFVPHEAMWARFRLEGSTRLIGFMIPAEYDGTAHQKTKMLFDSNVFYVVFLDKDHRFYPQG